jgi:RNA polymerase sigma-70 factor (ECF subfamily)
VERIFCYIGAQMFSPAKDSDQQPSVFPATRWSVVVRAGAAVSPDAHGALASLCRDYWRPLYFFARRRGHSREDAQDLTQGFILKLLESNSLAAADQNRGKFRTFLLSAFCHFLANAHRSRLAQRRGGEVAFVDMADPESEAMFAASLTNPSTPESEFDRNWAIATLESVMVRLRAEYVAAGRIALFESIQPHLTGGASRPGYAQIGQALGMSETAVTVAMHRMRKRYGQLLREIVASTLGPDVDVESELRHLIAILSSDSARA